MAIFVLTTTLGVSMFVPQVERLSNLNSLSLAQAETLESQEPGVFPVIEDRDPRRVIFAVATAYSSDPAQTNDQPCLPADWKYNLCEMYALYGAQDTIAANFLPLGTKVRFPDLYGDKVFTVRDRMNARYGEGRVDIWMPTYIEAKNFGLKRVRMEIFSK